MRNTWILKLTLLCCTAGLHARPGAAQPAVGPSSSDESKYVKLEGLLGRSGFDYFLREKDGTQEQLGGYSKLKDFVGHEIEVSGVQTVKTIYTTLPGGASSVAMKPIVNVKTVKDLGKSCRGTGN